MTVKDREAFDLFGNTIAVPVVKSVAIRLLNALNGKGYVSQEKTKAKNSQMELFL